MSNDEGMTKSEGKKRAIPHCIIFHDGETIRLASLNP
jgi:hypothetical protein